MARDTLDVIRRHNEQLELLLSEEGLAEIKRMVVLETALHAHTNHVLRSFRDSFREELPEASPELVEAISYFISLPDVPEPVRNIGKKVGSVANSYVKKKAGSILGGEEDEDA